MAGAEAEGEDRFGGVEGLGEEVGGEGECADCVEHCVERVEVEVGMGMGKVRLEDEKCLEEIRMREIDAAGSRGWCGWRIWYPVCFD